MYELERVVAFLAHKLGDEKGLTEEIRYESIAANDTTWVSWYRCNCKNGKHEAESASDEF